MDLDFGSPYNVREYEAFGGATFHHLGTIIQESEFKLYKELEFIRDPIQRVDVAFYRVSGLTIEVVKPYEESSPISRALRNGTFFHHICFSVPNIKDALEECKYFGIRKITAISPAMAFGGRMITWTYSKRYGLIELLEERL